MNDLSDDELLTRTTPEAFGAFYARHATAVEAYFRRRVDDADTAADLAADTFAAALVARRRYVPGDVPAAAWLYTIAGRRLIDHRRRATVDRRRFQDAGVALALAQIGDDDTAGSADWLRHLPAEQRDAVSARILRERGYDEIARRQGVSEAAARQRVSRGIGALRTPLRLYRAAQQVARQDRGYRFAGGHGWFLSAVGARDPLDCSSAASLVLHITGLFEADHAWTSGRLADEWGEPGEGRQMTLWASEDHVWLEFHLAADHAERFDPTPVRLAPQPGWLAGARSGPADAVPRHWPGL